MNNNLLDPGQLTVEEIDFEGLLPKITAEFKQVEKECKEKYGDDWFDHYVKIISPDIDIDPYEKIVNNAIYWGTEPNVMGTPEIMIKSRIRYEEKMKQLFGYFWKRHIRHNVNDPKINRLLIQDALKTGKWRELPKELHEEYNKQVKWYDK